MLQNRLTGKTLDPLESLWPEKKQEQTPVSQEKPKNKVNTTGTSEVKFIGVMPYEDGIRWSFEILAGKYKGQEVGVFTTINPSPDNICGKITEGVTGKHLPPNGHNVDLRPFVGKTYTITINNQGLVESITASNTPKLYTIPLDIKDAFKLAQHIGHKVKFNNGWAIVRDVRPTKKQDGYELVYEVA